MQAFRESSTPKHGVSPLIYLSRSAPNYIHSYAKEIFSGNEVPEIQIDQDFDYLRPKIRPRQYWRLDGKDLCYLLDIESLSESARSYFYPIYFYVTTTSPSQGLYCQQRFIESLRLVKSRRVQMLTRRAIVALFEEFLNSTRFDECIVEMFFWFVRLGMHLRPFSELLGSLAKSNRVESACWFLALSTFNANRNFDDPHVRSGLKVLLNHHIRLSRPEEDAFKRIEYMLTSKITIKAKYDFVLKNLCKERNWLERFLRSFVEIQHPLSNEWSP